MTGSRFPSASDVHPSSVLRGRLVRPLALLAITWVAACGGDGGTTEPEPAPQPNRPPAASGSIPAQTMTAGESVTVSVGGLFSDPDGDALTFTAISSNAGVASVALSGTDLTITAVAAGSATVTVTARDPSGLSTAASANVTVMEPNRAPVPAVPVAPAQTAIVGDTLNVDVSPFFTDPDGDALTYAATSANASVATVTVSGSVVSAAAVGAGSTTLTVTATDPDGLSGSLSVPVTVEANLPPEATQDSLPSLSIQERNSETVNVAQYFTDPNGQALTYEAESSDAGVATVSVLGSTMTVTAVAIGTATVTVTATDPYGLTASLSGSVTVIERVNQAPEAQTGISDLSRSVGWSGTLELERDPPLFVDPDGDELTYSAESSDPDVATLAVAGSVLTVATVAVGTTTGTVTATDPGGLSASVSFEITALPAAGLIFRDDFDDDSSLSDWEIEDGATAEVVEGILRLTNADTTNLGVATRELGSQHISWETTFRLGRAQVDSTVTSVIYFTGDERFPAFRMDIGSGITVTADGVAHETNYRFLIFDGDEEQFFIIEGWYGNSEAVHDGAGEFTEVSVSMTDRRLLVFAGTTELINFRFSEIVPDELSAVSLWVISVSSTTPRTGLFDWIEINGVPTESSATAGDYRSRTVVPMGVPGDVGVAREVSPGVLGESPPRVVGEGPPQRSLTPGRR